MRVSSLGRVRSLDRVITKMQRGCVVYAKVKGRMLKLHVPKNGYQFAWLSRGAQRCVHHLVLEAFVGLRPAGHQAAHGDGSKLNCALANLRWAMRKENEADKLRHGTAVFGANSPDGRKTHCLRCRPS